MSSSTATPIAAATSSATDEKKRSKKKWFPLESNPDALNHYISKLGFNTSLYSFVDVYAIDDECLLYFPPGCLGLVMLYPITEVQEEYRKLESQEMMKDNDTNNYSNSHKWFIKQRIGNACGTIGILHTLGNLPQPIQEMTIQPSSWLHKFYHQTPKSMSPIDKATILESDDDIEKHHDESTSDTRLNQTSRGDIDDKVETHFVSIVNVENEVYEFDGRKEGPVCHGTTSGETFLLDGVKVVRKFMERDPEEVRFTILALVPTQE